MTAQVSILSEEIANPLEEHASEAALFLKSIANKHRLMILCTLIGRELSVGQLNDMVPLSQSALSQHLACLRKAGLVSTRREAQTIYYRLHDNRAERVVAVLKDMYCPDS